MKEKKPGT
jgi:hypothetical protein